MALDLFPFVNMMFTNPREYEKVKNADKGRHTFMINRFFGIKYPTTAQSLNRNGINGWAVVDLWQIVAARFGKVPFWIYTKTKKAPSDKVWKPNPEVATLWMERNGLGPKDLELAIKFNPEEMKKSFASIEKQIQLYDK